MISNRVLDFILTILVWIVVPVQVFTTFVLGILVMCTFGLLLLPLSLLWITVMFPLIGASWLCSRFELLRNPVGFLGIPMAVIAHTYCCLMPSMGELESRANKVLLTESWPFSWEYWQFSRGRLDLDSSEGEALSEILVRISRADPLKQRTIDRLCRNEPLDSQLAS